MNVVDNNKFIIETRDKNGISFTTIFINEIEESWRDNYKENSLKSKL